MPNTHDWLPAGRELKLAMAKDWLAVLAAQAAAWHVPEAEVLALQSLTINADAALASVQCSSRTPIATAQCKAAFEALVEKMRLIKSHYFLVPPLDDTGFVALGLKPKDAAHTPVPPPSAQAEADITRPGVHLIELHLRPLAGTTPDPHHSDYGFRVYYGILPPGGASVEAALSPKRELVKAPVSGEELPHSRFTRRKREMFDFAAEDSGKTVYFCVRYENAKGEPGPWGPLFSSVVP
jgi:hypothetical protein